MKQKLHGSERLMAAARQLLIDGGPRAVTVQGMAAMVGVSAPSLYRHFAGRDEVIARLQREGWSKFRAALATSLKARGPLARLRACGQRYVEFGLENPQIYRLLFLSDEASRPPTKDEPRVSPGLSMVVVLVRDCQRVGALSRRANPEDLAIAFWAASHGLVALYLQGGGAPRFGRKRYLSLVRRALVSLTRKD